MVDSHQVSRRGGDQYLVIEHDGEIYEVEKVSYQKDVDGELVDVEEYRIDQEDEPVPVEVANVVAQANGNDVNELDLVENDDVQDDVDDDRPDDRNESDDADEDDELDEPVV